MPNLDGYLGNSKLKNINLKQKFTEEQIIELSKCADDLFYFVENYVKIRNVDEEGLIPLHLRDYQQNLIKQFRDERFVIVKFPRQYGKCVYFTTVCKFRHKDLEVSLPLGLFFLLTKFNLTHLLYCLGKLQMTYKKITRKIHQRY